ncbi:MAG: hypothetical protein ABWK05_06150 [Pyrobaculum sp.]
MEKLVQWVEAFNTIARNENNFHSFYIERREDFVDAALTLEEVARQEDCTAGSFAKAEMSLKEGEAFLEMTTGTYRKCPTASGYVAEYTKNTSHRIDLGDDPELQSYIKSIKNEGDFIALLEAVLQAASR